MRINSYLRMAVLLGSAVLALFLTGGQPISGGAHKTISVTLPGDYFDPFVVTASVGDTVKWTNTDDETHVVATVSDTRADPFNLTIAPGKSASMTFTQAGVYDVYCTLHATYDKKLGRVVANKGTDAHPIPMEQVIIVLGPGMKPAPVAHATVTAPGDVFTPYITVIRQGGTVTYLNKDSDPHAIAGAPNSPRAFPRAATLAAGKSVTVTFPTAGVYDYYCPLHAAYHAKFKEVGANKGTDAYPVCMQGFVVVVPSR